MPLLESKLRGVRHFVHLIPACVLSLDFLLVCFSLGSSVKVLSIESVHRQEEGSTGKYQHEVGGVPEGLQDVFKFIGEEMTKL